MPPSLKLFLHRWAITTAAVLVAANVVQGIHYDHGVGLLLASLLLGILNAFLRPLLLVLSLPLLVFTLGLFTTVINALLLYLVGSVLTSFHVQDFWAAFWGGLVISVVSLALNLLTGFQEMKLARRKTEATQRPPKDGQGPIIDV